MANMYRKRKMTDRATERHFRFVVQIPVPEGGFASALDAMKAWHCYSASMQRPAISPGDQGVTAGVLKVCRLRKSFDFDLAANLAAPATQRYAKRHRGMTPRGNVATKLADQARRQRCGENAGEFAPVYFPTASGSAVRSLPSRKTLCCFSAICCTPRSYFAPLAGHASG